MSVEISSEEELFSYPSFRRWAKGTATKQDAEKWDEWCRQSESNRRLAAKAQAELLGIRSMFDDQADAGDEWREFMGKIKKVQLTKLNSHRKTSPIVWWYRAAAAFLVIAITSFLSLQWQQSSTESQQDEIVWQEVTTDNAEQKRVTLTDGSSIVLSANSAIVYSDNRNRNSEVEIKLKGEAYFSIPPREKSNAPFFRVRTSNGTVLVTGTRFVVDVDESRTRVVLEEGSVNIERVAEDKSEKEIINLEPNQLAEFNNELVTIKNVNPEVYTSWTSHKLVLDNTPFRFLAEKIKKTYGVEVKVNNGGLYERRLTGTLNFRGLDLLLQAVSEVLEIEVVQKDDKVIFEPNANTN